MAEVSTAYHEWLLREKGITPEKLAKMAFAQRVRLDNEYRAAMTTIEGLPETPEQEPRQEPPAAATAEPHPASPQSPARPFGQMSREEQKEEILRRMAGLRLTGKVYLTDKIAPGETVALAADNAPLTDEQRQTGFYKGHTIYTVGDVYHYLNRDTEGMELFHAIRKEIGVAVGSLEIESEESGKTGKTVGAAGEETSEAAPKYQQQDINGPTEGEVTDAVTASMRKARGALYRYRKLLAQAREGALPTPPGGIPAPSIAGTGGRITDANTFTQRAGDDLRAVADGAARTWAYVNQADTSIRGLAHLDAFFKDCPIESLNQ